MSQVQTHPALSRRRSGIQERTGNATAERGETMLAGPEVHDCVADCGNANDIPETLQSHSCPGLKAGAIDTEPQRALAQEAAMYEVQGVKELWSAVLLPCRG